jgi:hypothetical protein
LSVQKTEAEYLTASLHLRRGKPTVRVKIRGAGKEFIADNGSAVSLIKPGMYRSKVRSSSTTSFGVTGDTLDIMGEQDVQFCHENWNYRHTFCVCALPTDADGILGIDFLSEMGASLDIGRKMLKLRKNRNKRTPKLRRGNGETERIFVFEVERRACPRARHGNASSCDAQVATVERQYGDKRSKLKKRPFRKRLTIRWKTEREAPVHAPQDKKIKTRHFEVNDLVYLYWPVTKPGLTRKFRKSWSGPYKIIRKISELNYEIVDQMDKKQIVHMNRLKRSYDQSLWKSKSRQKPRKKAPKQSDEHLDSSEKAEIQIGPFPLATPSVPSNNTEHTSPRNQVLDTPGSDAQALDTPSSEQADPSYRPPETPRSRRELQTTHMDPPVTRSRTRILTQDTANV